MDRSKFAKVLGLALVAAFAVAAGGFAQGVQTATLTGNVTSADGEPMPGVMVTATSDALIGERTTSTGVNGDYILKNLNPGVYKITFALEGMGTVEREATLPLGGNARSDASMAVASAEETIVVTGEAPSALETVTVGKNFEAEEINVLPVTRTLAGIAELSGGLTDNTPVAGQVTINGALAYDNSILLNGVNIQDPIFGTANTLFIEDAIEETQVLTSGVSAEYGGFSGGVINAVTKSGGNRFSGSFRASFDKPEWRDETPFEKDRNVEREGDLGKSFTATLGGPILKDRLWFFLAGRDDDREVANTLAITSIPFTNEILNERYEIKLTGNVTPSHSLSANYVVNDTTQNNNLSIGAAVDPRTLVDRELPNDGWTVAYNGIFSNNLFGELRYSEKAFEFKNAGGTSTAITDSPFRSQGVSPNVGGFGRTYNAPYFDATDPENRDNEQIYGALSYFLSTSSMGSHDMKAGLERFTVTRTGGNSQTATDFVFYTDYKTSGPGAPVFDAQGRFIPVFTPFLSGAGNWVATRGAELDITTDSLFFNDRWLFNEHLALNLGFRYEVVDSKVTGGLSELDTKTLVPRLGASYDVLGDGKWKVDVTYAEYAGRYNPAVFGRNTPVGNPSLLYGYYVGPAGEGIGFAPGLDPSNYVFYYAAVPTQNIFFDSSLSSPTTSEITLSGGMQLANGGFLKLTYVDRKLDEVLEDFVNTSTGQTDIVFNGTPGPTVDNIVYRNSSVPSRDYQSILLQGRYRIMENWIVDGNVTHQLKNEGFYEGESGQAITTSTFGNYPEIFNQTRNFPVGKFDDYQENKIRLWTTYSLDFGNFGALDIGLIGRYDSPLTFSYFANNVPLSAQQAAGRALYASAPTNQTLFFGERGAGEFNSVTTFDLALNYAIPVWKSFEPWVKFEVRNLTNDDTLVTYDTTITAIRTPGAPVDQYGLATTFTKGANFGKATSAASHVVPREYLVSAGIRF